MKKLLFALFLLLPAQASAQQYTRVGFLIGGGGLIGALVERRGDNFGMEAQIGTRTFTDLTLAVNAKVYTRSKHVDWHVGAGLWAYVGLRNDLRELAVRIPLGMEALVSDDRVLGESYAGGFVFARHDPDEDPDDPRPRTLDHIETSYRSSGR